MAGDKDGINNVELAIAAIYTQRTKNQFTILTLRIINDTHKCIGDFLTRQSIYLFENIDDLCKDFICENRRAGIYDGPRRFCLCFDVVQKIAQERIRIKVLKHGDGVPFRWQPTPKRPSPACASLR